MRMALLKRLMELRHFQIYKGELVIENFIGFNIGQFHPVDELFTVSLVLLEDEVEDTDCIDGLEIVVPSALAGLFTDGEGGIEDGTLLEEILLGLLHLYDEFLAAAAFAIDVENSLAVGIQRA